MAPFYDCIVIDDILKTDFYKYHSIDFIKEYGIYLNHGEYIKSNYYNESTIRIIQLNFNPSVKKKLFDLILHFYAGISSLFIKDYFNEFSFNAHLMRHPLLSDEVLLEIMRSKEYTGIIGMAAFNEETIMKMYDASLVRLKSILLLQKVSENFILKYINDFSEREFNILSSSQILSENFILEHGDKLNWNDLIQYQHISTKIHEKYLNEIHKALSSNRKQPKCSNLQKRDIY